MSRWDLTGLFWDDYVEPRKPVEKVKREPPEPVWLADDYLPGLAEAEAYKFDLMSDYDLYRALEEKHRLVWDTEFYPNYALCGFRDIVTNKLLYFETFDNYSFPDRDKLQWILKNFLLIGFNDRAFDWPMAMAILAGFGTEQLWTCVDTLINGTIELPQGMRPREFFKHFGLSYFNINNIDLLELTPLGPSLKICSGRVHAQRMADLPFPAGKWLSPDQIKILRYYWTNDVQNTHALYEKHKTAIELREILTQEYGVDVRSSSDPQIAEAIIRKEVLRVTGQKYIQKAQIRAGETFRYQPPQYLKFKTPKMQWVLDFVCRQDFTIDAQGKPNMSEDLAALVVDINETQYQMGEGGLHSKEKRVIHKSDEFYQLSDNDVTSYYPSLIIQQGMYPPNVGPAFLQVFERIYTRRITAKRNGDKNTAETLKIVLNGTFGKTGERGGHSVVYFPEMMIQVTVTGQLSLMMLIEWLELAGIQVVSANTDGIVIKCHKDKEATKAAIIDKWQMATGLELESKNYKAVYSRDVNNYIALLDKPDPKVKGVWAHAKSIGAYRQVTDAYPLKWNPTCDVCAEAVIGFLALNKPIEDTIREETDFRKFIEVRRVNGGACKDGEYLGKAIRWYYSNEIEDEIINAKNGYNVPRSKGARPCMTLPDEIPADLDYDLYIARAFSMLEDFEPKKKKEKAAA